MTKPGAVIGAARWAQPAEATAREAAQQQHIADLEALAQRLAGELRDLRENGGRRLAAAELRVRRLTDDNAELRRRIRGAQHLVYAFDATAGAGHTAVLLIDLRMLLESSRDTRSAGG